MAFLRIMSGDLKGRKIEVDRDEVTIGRAPEAVISLDDPAVSGTHCAVIRDGKKYSLRDLESTNGTTLNGSQVSESRLKPKDIIRVGSVDMVFDGSDVAVEDAVPLPSTARDVPGEPGVSAASAPATSQSPFGAKREAKWQWAALIAFVGILALGALAWFLFRLFRS